MKEISIEDFIIVEIFDQQNNFILPDNKFNINIKNNVFQTLKNIKQYNLWILCPVFGYTDKKFDVEIEHLVDIEDIRGVKDMKISYYGTLKQVLNQEIYKTKKIKGVVCISVKSIFKKLSKSSLKGGGKHDREEIGLDLDIKCFIRQGHSSEPFTVEYTPRLNQIDSIIKSEPVLSLAIKIDDSGTYDGRVQLRQDVCIEIINTLLPKFDSAESLNLEFSERIHIGWQTKVGDSTLGESLITRIKEMTKLTSLSLSNATLSLNQFISLFEGKKVSSFSIEKVIILEPHLFGHPNTQKSPEDIAKELGVLKSLSRIKILNCPQILDGLKFVISNLTNCTSLDFSDHVFGEADTVINGVTVSERLIDKIYNALFYNFDYRHLYPPIHDWGGPQAYMIKIEDEYRSDEEQPDVSVLESRQGNYFTSSNTKVPNLISLNLANNCIRGYHHMGIQHEPSSEPFMKKLVDLLKTLDTLEELNLARNHLQKEDIEHIVAYINERRIRKILPSLKTLDLSSNYLALDSIIALMDIFPRSLTSLKISRYRKWSRNDPESEKVNLLTDENIEKLEEYLRENFNSLVVTYTGVYQADYY